MTQPALGTFCGGNVNPFFFQSFSELKQNTLENNVKYNKNSFMRNSTKQAQDAGLLNVAFSSKAVSKLIDWNEERQRRDFRIQI